MDGLKSHAKKNLNTHEEIETQIDDRGGFSIHLASNQGDLMELSIYDQQVADVPAYSTRFRARVNGHGRRLNTPDFRRSAFVLSQILERCDPMAFASRYNPLTNSSDLPPVKTLVSVALGDESVPINTSVFFLANAFGLLGLTEEQNETALRRTTRSSSIKRLTS